MIFYSFRFVKNILHDYHRKALQAPKSHNAASVIFSNENNEVKLLKSVLLLKYLETQPGWSSSENKINYLENKSQLRASIKTIEFVNKNKNANLNTNYELK